MNKILVVAIICYSCNNDGRDGHDGVSGIQGIQGETGPRGVQGETGPRGVQGETGEHGPQGIQGERGETGPQGIQGEPGIAPEQEPSNSGGIRLLFQYGLSKMIGEDGSWFYQATALWYDRVFEVSCYPHYAAADGKNRCLPLGDQKVTGFGFGYFADSECSVPIAQWGDINLQYSCGDEQSTLKQFGYVYGYSCEYNKTVYKMYHLGEEIFTGYVMYSDGTCHTSTSLCSGSYRCQTVLEEIDPEEFVAFEEE